MSRLAKISTLCLLFAVIAFFGYVPKASATNITGVAMSTTSITANQPVTITVVITGQNATPDTTGASLVLNDNGTQIDIANTPGSFSPAGTHKIKATFTTTFGVGSHSLQAILTAGAADSCGTCSSNTIAFTLNSFASTTTIALATGNTGTTVLGQSAAFTASVDGGANGVPTGTVQFKEGNVVLGSAPLTGSSNPAKATFTTSLLTISGSPHTIQAFYLSDANFLSSNSTVGAAQTISKRDTTIAIGALSKTSVGIGVSTSFTATVTDVNTNGPAGTPGALVTTGSLPAGSGNRIGHASTLMPDGSVLITGGTSSTGTVLTASSLYSAGTFTDSPALDLPSGRTGHTATRLRDGRVLIVGGSGTGLPAGVTSTALILDPTTGLYTTVNNAGPAVMNHTATLLSNGTVLIAGGFDNTGQRVTTTTIFTLNSSPADGSNSTFAAGPVALNHARAGHTATLLPSGIILMAGGSGSLQGAGDAELYDVSGVNNGNVPISVDSTNHLVAEHTFHTATLFSNGIVALMGGLDSSNNVLTTIEFYDPANDTFTSVAGGPGLQGHTARMMLDGTILVVGGSTTNATGGATTAAQVYIPPFDPQGSVTPSADAGTNTPTSCTLALAGNGHPSCVASIAPNDTGARNVSAQYGGSTVHNASPVSATDALAVNPTLKFSAHTDTKVYDGNTTSSQTPDTVDVTALTGTDAVSTLTGEFVEAFDQAAAGTRTLSITNVKIRDSNGTGTDHTGNYFIDTGSPAVGAINTKTITATLSAQNKVYDKTTIEPDANMACTFNGLLPADTAKVTCTPSNGQIGTGTGGGFAADGKVGTGKTVQATTMLGDAAGNAGASNNYTLGAAGTTTSVKTLNNVEATGVSVTPKTLVVTGITVTPKTYDATKTANLDLTNEKLLTAEAAGAGTTADGAPYTGDDVSLTLPLAATGQYASKDVANGIAVAVTGDSLSGVDKANYQLAADEQPTLTGNITRKPLVVQNLSAADKLYDATLNATLSGSASLLAAEAPGTGSTSDNKPYTADTVSVDPASIAAGQFASKNVGNAIAVSISGLTLTGAQAGNYNLATNQQPGVAAKISPKTLVMAGLTAANKVYDATPKATLSGTASLLPAEAPGGSTADNTPYTGDAVSVDPTSIITGTFATRHAGTGVAVAVSGGTLTGGEAGNYQLAANQQPNLAANITAKTLRVQGLSVAGKTYDATNAATLSGTATLLAQSAPGAGVATDGASYTGDSVTLNGTPVGVFTSIHAGTHTVTVSGQTISGPEVTLGDYQLAADEQGGLSATIGTKNVTPSVTASNKHYDGTNIEPNSNMSCSFPGAFASDTNPTSPNITCSATAGTFPQVNVGPGLTVSLTVTLAGPSSGDYTMSTAGTTVTTLTPVTTTASIVPVVLIPTLTAQSKVYDRSTAASTITCSLAPDDPTNDLGVFTAEQANLTCAASAGAFDSANAGARTVTATMTVGGTAAGNYTVVKPAAIPGTLSTSGSASANIFTRVLTPVLSAANKTYDGTATEPNAAMSCSFGSQVLAGDTITCAVSGNGTFDSIHAGATRSVTASTVMGGSSVANYTVGAANTITSVTTVPATATPVAIFTLVLTPTLAAANKTYDGTTNEPNANLSCSFGIQILGTDNVTCAVNGNGAFDNANAGTGHTVTASVTMSGTSNSDYTLGTGNTTTGTTTSTLTAAGVTIFTLPITPALTATSKLYDGTTTEPNANMTCSFGTQIQGTDSVTCSVTGNGAFDLAVVGTRTVTASVAMGGTSAPNYTLGAANTTTSTTSKSGVTASSSISKAHLTVTADNKSKIFDGAIFPVNSYTATITGFVNGETDAGLRSSGALSGLPSFSGTAITGTNTGSYTITPSINTLSATNYDFPAGNFKNGTLSIQIAKSNLGVVTTQAIDSNGVTTFSFTTSVGGNGPTPGGTVTFTEGTKPISGTVNGQAITNGVVTLSGGTGAITLITLPVSPTPHVILASYSGDSNYLSATLNFSLTVFQQTQAITAGAGGGINGTGSPTSVPVSLATSATAPASLQGSLPCTIKSSTGVVPNPAFIKCTASLSGTLAQGASGTVVINVMTNPGTVTSGSIAVPGHSNGGSMGALYALSFGLPAFVFVGLAAPVTVSRKRTWRGKMLAMLGLMLVLSFLMLSVGCGGAGFTNTDKLGATANLDRVTPGVYTAIVTYQDANTQAQVLATMSFTVN